MSFSQCHPHYISNRRQLERQNTRGWVSSIRWIAWRRRYLRIYLLSAGDHRRNMKLNRSACWDVVVMVTSETPSFYRQSGCFRNTHMSSKWNQKRLLTWFRTMNRLFDTNERLRCCCKCTTINPLCCHTHKVSMQADPYGETIKIKTFYFFIFYTIGKHSIWL